MKQFTNVFLHFFSFFFFYNAMQLCCPVLWNWWGRRFKLWEIMKSYPLCVFPLHADYIRKQSETGVFKLFKLPFLAKTSFLSIINSVTRCCRWLKAHLLSNHTVLCCNSYSLGIYKVFQTPFYTPRSHTTETIGWPQYRASASFGE